MGETNSLTTTDRGREGTTFYKSLAIAAGTVAYLARKWIYPSRSRLFNALLPDVAAYYQKVTDFDPKTLAQRMSRTLDGQDFRLIIFDVDACLTAPYQAIPADVVSYISALVDGDYQVVIYTNAPISSRLQPLVAAGAKLYQGTIPKPNPQGFRTICHEAGLKPSDYKYACMVGDDVFDAWASHVGITSVLIEAVPTMPEGLTNKQLKKANKIYRQWILEALGMKSPHLGIGRQRETNRSSL